ncbi:hypothetical protein P7C70_g3107, partial [Phenoliferia sp. Uapishka_3]
MSSRKGFFDAFAADADYRRANQDVLAELRRDSQERRTFEAFEWPEEPEERPAPSKQPKEPLTKSPHATARRSPERIPRATEWDIRKSGGIKSFLIKKEGIKQALRECGLESPDFSYARLNAQERGDVKAACTRICPSLSNFYLEWPIKSIIDTMYNDDKA